MDARFSTSRRGYLRAVGMGAGIASIGVGSVSAAGANGQVVFIYDDSAKTDYSVAFPVHQEEGVPACSAAISASVIADRPDSMFIGPEKLSEMADAGWEMISHTLFHRYWGEQHIERDITPDDTKLYLPSQILGDFENFKLRVADGENKSIVTVSGSGKDDDGNYVALKNEIGTEYTVSDGTIVRYPNDQVEDMMSRSKKMLKDKTGAEVTNLVYPYGAHSSYVDSLASNHFDGIGNFYDGSGLNPRTGFNPYRTDRTEFSRKSMSDSEMASFFDKVAHGNKLGVLGGHTYYDSFDADRIRTAIRMAKKRDIEVVTFQQAIEDNVTTTTQTPTPTATPTRTATPTSTPTATPARTTTARPSTTSTKRRTTTKDKDNGLFRFFETIIHDLTSWF